MKQLKGIGQRTADLMVAELGGKMKEFAGGAPLGPSPERLRLSRDENDAVDALVSLGEPRGGGGAAIGAGEADQAGGESGGGIDTGDAVDKRNVKGT